MDVSAIRTRLENVIALSRLLQGAEEGGLRVAAGQYRQLVAQLQKALSEPVPAEALRVILDAHPAASEVYENLHYEHAGLSRAPLERSAASELLARSCLARIAAAAKMPAASEPRRAP